MTSAWKSGILILMFLTLFCVSSFVFSEEIHTIQHPETRENLKLFPYEYDRLIDLPSPFRLNDGIEILMGFTKDKKVTLVPVTVENGKSYVYAKSGKGKQLEVDARDFPVLAKTGLHSEMELDQTQEITGRSVSKITEIGRPGRSSSAGFMSSDEDIISVLKGDNRLVKKLGLTHPQMARPLFHVWNLILKTREVERFWGKIGFFLYNGRKVFYEAGRTRGWQESIFNDEIYGGFQIKIWRELEEKEKDLLDQDYAHLSDDQRSELIEKLSRLFTGEMEPYYVMRYGFYEGHTEYRVDPIAIAFVFGLRDLREIEGAFQKNLYEALTEHFTRESPITRRRE
jgi:hypothetical protein